MFKNIFGFIVDLFKLIHRGQDMKMNARISNYGGKTLQLHTLFINVFPKARIRRKKASI